MSKHELDEMDTTGYFLPEESQFRLKKLHAHMEFLSQLAQPRRHDEEETGFSPEISGNELAVCLELLAEQAERVLDEVTWPAEREVGAKRSQALDEDEPEDEEEDSAEAGEAEDALAAGAQDDAEAGAAPPARDPDDVPHEAGEASAAADADATADATADPFVIGMTMDQLDALNRLHDRLHAYGDMVLGLERMNLADGTPTVLGEVIFEDAEAASKLMDQVAEQRLPDERRGVRRVREAHALYGAPTGPGPAFEAAMSRLPPPGSTGWHPPATLH